MIQHAIDKATLFATPVVNFEKVYNPKNLILICQIWTKLLI